MTEGTPGTKCTIIFQAGERSWLPAFVTSLLRRTPGLKGEQVSIVRETPFKVDANNHRLSCIYVFRGEPKVNVIQFGGWSGHRAPCWGNSNKLVFAGRSVIGSLDKVMRDELKKAILACFDTSNQPHAVCVKDGIVCEPTAVKSTFGGLALAWALFCIDDDIIKEVWGSTDESKRKSPLNPELEWSNVYACLTFFCIPRAEIVKVTYDLRCFIKPPTHTPRKRRYQETESAGCAPKPSTPGNSPSPDCISCMMCKSGIAPGMEYKLTCGTNHLRERVHFRCYCELKKHKLACPLCFLHLV